MSNPAAAWTLNSSKKEFPGELWAWSSAAVGILIRREWKSLGLVQMASLSKQNECLTRVWIYNFRWFPGWSWSYKLVAVNWMQSLKFAFLSSTGPGKEACSIFCSHPKDDQQDKLLSLRKWCFPSGRWDSFIREFTVNGDVRASKRELGHLLPEFTIGWSISDKPDLENEDQH